jgi:hypothetical protein
MQHERFGMVINGIEIRKLATFVEEVFHEGGPVADRPLKLGAIASRVAMCRTSRR